MIYKPENQHDLHIEKLIPNQKTLRQTGLASSQQTKSRTTNKQGIQKRKKGATGKNKNHEINKRAGRSDHFCRFICNWKRNRTRDL